MDVITAPASKSGRVLPACLYNGVTGRPAECHAIAEGCHGRDEAAREMIRHLYAKSAPAVGFGPHYRVTPWVSQVR